MAEAGPVPHEPQNGRIVRFKGFTPRNKTPKVNLVASGARLMVDVEYGRGHLYGLSQGIFPAGNPPGSPADHDTGSLAGQRPRHAEDRHRWSGSADVA